MKMFHLYFLCAAIFLITAILQASSDTVLTAVFVILGMMCTVVGFVKVSRNGGEEH